MLNISKSNLALLVSSVEDAIKYNVAFLNSETIKDNSDYEEHLLCLENFRAWLEGEYKRLQKVNPDLLTHEQITRRKL